MALKVNGKTALVTGGGSGICLEFTKLLLSKGCNVLIADLNLTPDAEKLMSAHESREEGKARAVFKKTDVTNWDLLQAAFDECMSAFESLDIVCPGAGVFEPVCLPFFSFIAPASQDYPSKFQTSVLTQSSPGPISGTSNPPRTASIPIPTRRWKSTWHIQFEQPNWRSTISSAKTTATGP